MNTRLKFLLAAAAGAAAWSGWVVTNRAATADDTIAEPVRAVRRAAAAERRDPAPAELPPLPGLRHVAAVPGKADAFAARDWAPAPPPPPPPPPVIAVPVPPPPPPAAPPPPTLPYRFVGVAEAGLSTTPRVFLSLNDKLLIAAAGDTLEGGFRLDAITPRELVFTHLQLNVQLRLSVQGASS